MDAAPRDLPPQQTSGPYRIAVVCLGNICRSPMAHVVLESHLAATGLAERVEVSSAGTAGWHVGKPMDERAAAALAAAGHDPTRHRAQQYDASWTSSYDLVLVMDDSNLADVGGRSERVAKFRDFDPLETGSDVPDPYYGGDEGFAEVLGMVARTSETIVERCRRVLR